MYHLIAAVILTKHAVNELFVNNLCVLASVVNDKLE